MTRLQQLISQQPVDAPSVAELLARNAGSGLLVKIKDDPRVTPVGRFLRRTSIDELPQLMNVVLGNMSLVGPRPHAVTHNEEYRKLIKGYMLRHKVRPGITGLAQVEGWRGSTSLEKRIERDLWYIENWSLLFDFYILAKTPVSLLTLPDGP